MMPMLRRLQEILDQADDAAGLRAVRAAFQARAEGHSWAATGAMVGTSGVAARQRYGQPATKR
jgi:hypothetical protein